jgi:GGDEF domain-containing protein
MRLSAKVYTTLLIAASALLVAVAGWTAAPAVCLVLLLVQRLHRIRRTETSGRQQEAERLQAVHAKLIETLAFTLHAGDATARRRARLVREYAVEAGRLLGMGDDDLAALWTAAALHAIGKLACTSAEGQPLTGAAILDHLGFPTPVGAIVRAQHEMWSGGGPDGLEGEQIPLGARILAVAKALACTVPPGRGYSLELPLEAIRKESGRSFDPKVVAVIEAHRNVLETKARTATAMELKLPEPVRVARTAGAPLATGRSPHDWIATVSRARGDLQLLASRGLEAKTMALDEFCAVLAVRLQRTVPHDAFVLWIARSGRLSAAYVHGVDHERFSRVELREGQGLSGWALENSKPVLNGDASLNCEYPEAYDGSSALQSALAVPLDAGDVSIGVLALYRLTKDAFCPEELRLIEALAPRLTAAITKIRNRGEPADTSLRNHGECLPVLRHIDSELARARRLNLPLGVVACSLAGTAERGDQGADTEVALRTMVGVLRDGCSDHEMLGRLSETEFVLVTLGSSLDSLQARCARLMKTRFTISGYAVAAGAASFPRDGTDSTQLLAAAERALFRSWFELAGPKTLAATSVK